MNEVITTGGHPQALYVAIAAITAALLTGFFSFLNMISAKENKVSEFRLSWADGLRNEVAEFVAAIHELSHLENIYTDFIKDKDNEYERTKDLIELRQEAYKNALECAYKIRMRLNYKHAEKENTPEEKLKKALEECIDLFNAEKYVECTKYCQNIRVHTSPILKSTWDLVKKGEIRYRIIRAIAQTLVISGALAIGHIAIKQTTTKPSQKTEKASQEMKSQDTKNNYSEHTTKEANPSTHEKIN